MSKIVFCESYGSIPYTLQLIIEDPSDTPATVVMPAHKDLAKFFQELNQKSFNNSLELVIIESVHLESTNNRVKRIMCLAADIVKEREYLKNLWDTNFAGKSGYDVVFLSRAYSGAKYFLLKKLSKKNNLIFLHNTKKPLMDQYTPESLTDYGTLIAYMLMYGFGIRLGRYLSVKSIPWISDTFLKKKMVGTISKEESDELIQRFDFDNFRIFDNRNSKVIFFDSPLIEAGYIGDREIYKKELRSIFEILLRYYSEDEVSVKNHPGFTGEQNLMPFGTVLPSYIPAEFLDTSDTDVLIAVSSGALGNSKDTLAVCVADLVTFSRNQDRETLKNYLRDNANSEILFPDSLESLDIIIKDLSKGNGY